MKKGAYLMFIGNYKKEEDKMDELTAIKLIKKTKKSNSIAEGSSRRVYNIDGYIIKKAKNNRGKIECKNENWLYNNITGNYKQFLCPVLYSDVNHIIMKKAELISPELFENFIEEKVRELIDYLWETYQMDDLDLRCSFNWGLIDNQPVVIDYGHNYFGESLVD